MMIKMLLEEAGHFFYCEAKRTAPHSFEGIVHFLHKVGHGNAFVRGETHVVQSTFDCRNDALTAAERHGRNVALMLGRADPTPTEQSDYDSLAQGPARPGNKEFGNSAR